jgi:hypothetical protein
MIPLFTPATARKDVNKVQGDGELAKLANLNRLVENVNTIVTNGIPAVGPTLTYTNVGAVTDMSVLFAIGVDPATIPNPTGTKTVQSYYLPAVELNGGNGANSALTSIIFPDVVLGGGVDIASVANLTTVGLPLLTKTLSGNLVITGSSGKIVALSTPLLNYIYGSLNLNKTTFNLSLVTYIGAGFHVTECPGTSVNFPVLGYVGERFDIDDCPNITSISAPNLSSCSASHITNCNSLTSINLASLSAVGDGLIQIENCSSLTSINLSGCNVSPGGELRLNNLSSLTSLTLNGPLISGPYGLQVDGLPDLTSISTTATTFHMRINVDSSINTGLATLSAPNATDFYFWDYRGEEGSPYPSALTSVIAPATTTLYIRTVNSSITSLNFPVVTQMSRLKIVGSLITTLNVSTVINYDVAIEMANNTNLTSITLGTIGTLKSIAGSIELINCALNVASVNNLLALLVSLDGTNDTTLYENHTVYLNNGTSSAPTGQGILDVATLTSRGCTVTTN